MAQDLTLHIGTPKSGTTYLQATLRAGRRALHRAGILYPGEQYLPDAGFNQQPAVYAVGRRYIRWPDEDAVANGVRHLGRLCEEISAHRGPVLLSAESLAFFAPAEIEQLLDRLQADPARTRVVVTARDLGRVLPSIWQQNVKNGATQPIDEYLDSVAALRGVPDVPLWTAFGLPGLVRRWSGVVGTGSVTLVTAPRGDRDLLWQRFAAATQVPSDLLATSGSGTSFDRNQSLSWPQAEVLRHLNEVLQARQYDAARAQATRRRLLRVWLSAGTPSGPRIGLPAALAPLVARWADEDTAGLAGTGVRVVGSLDDLRLPPASGSGFGSPTVRLDDVASDVLQLLEHAATDGGRRPGGARTTLRRLVRAARRRAAGPRVPLPRPEPDRGAGGATLDLTAGAAKDVRRP